MPLHGYIIEKYNNMGNAYTCRRLAEEARRLQMDLRIVGIHDTVAAKDRLINRGQVLEKCDFVINRYKWGKMKDAVNALAARSYNPLEAFQIYVNKYEQVSRLRSDDFLIPAWAMGTASLPYEELTAYLGSPFVAKGLESSMGEEIILIREPGDYGRLKAEYDQAKEWLYEAFVRTSYGRDMRFYSIRGKVIACMVRESQGDFRANVALGARVRPMEITAQISRIAEQIYDQTGLDFLGIDLMFGDDKPYFCEINVMPGIEGIEKASGVNVAGEIMRTIRDDFERGEHEEHAGRLCL